MNTFCRGLRGHLANITLLPVGSYCATNIPASVCTLKQETHTHKTIIINSELYFEIASVFWFFLCTSYIRNIQINSSEVRLKINLIKVNNS